MSSPRTAEVERKTKETDIRLVLNIDGKGKGKIEVGVGFFEHMLAALAKHGRMDIELTCKGDLHIDEHHTVEDVGIVLGQALGKALGDRAGTNRFGEAFAPLDESVNT